MQSIGKNGAFALGLLANALDERAAPDNRPVGGKRIYNFLTVFLPIQR